MPYADPEKRKEYFRRYNQLPHRKNRSHGKPTKEKRREYNLRWKEKHPEKWMEHQRNSHIKRYADPIKYKKVIDYHRQIARNVREYCQELKERTSCFDCHKNDKYYLMDFDHREGTNNRSPMSCRSMPELKRELVKCDIVCVRCHRVRTYVRQTEKKYKRN